jgi:hypothetical protein
MAALIDALTVAGVLTLCLLLLPLSGWWFAARFRGDGLQRFTAACLVGVVLLAAIEVMAYALRLPQWFAFFLLAFTCAVSARHLYASFRAREFAWNGLLTWAGMGAILTAATLRYAVHGYGTESWDWYEHWLRSLIFLGRSPIATKIGYYSVASRGPLFNAASALLMSLTGSHEYWVFQIIAIALNTLICLPFALMLEAIGGISRRASLLVAAGVCILNPFFFSNNTYTWTKDLAGAFVLMGIYRYLMAYRKDDAAEMARSLVWFAAGFLCHFLALIYAAIVGLHLLDVKRRELPIRELIRAVVLSATIVGLWFGYMFVEFGVKQSLLANTTMGGYYVDRDQNGNATPLPFVMIGNLCTNLVPVQFCRPVLNPALGAPCKEVAVQEGKVTATSVPCPPGLDTNGIYGVLGYSGLAAVLLAAIGLLRAAPVPERRFLFLLLVGGLLFNLLPIRWSDPLGTFQENLQPWCLVLFALVVRGLVRVWRPAMAAVVLAMFMEYAAADLGIIRAQTIVLPLAHYSAALRGNPPIGLLWPSPTSSVPIRAGFVYYGNYLYKIMGGAFYFRDRHPSTFAGASWLLLAAGILALAMSPQRFLSHVRTTQNRTG